MVGTRLREKFCRRMNSQIFSRYSLILGSNSTILSLSWRQTSTLLNEKKTLLSRYFTEMGMDHGWI